jgi:SAM-dependent methyltransferase
MVESIVDFGVHGIQCRDMDGTPRRSKGFDVEDDAPALRASESGETWRRLMQRYLRPNAEVTWEDDNFPVCPITNRTPGLMANSLYFDNDDWARNYFDGCHRDEQFRARWLSTTGAWDDKIVVDIGCGPGNVFATLGGAPRLLIGVDVSRGALAMARKLGYRPILADAHSLPFISHFADIVVLNASLHHCDDMSRVLAEAARLVAPGGMLVTDHDPQLSAWNFKGPARWAWDLRLLLYRWLKKGFHGSLEEQALGLQSEIHHAPSRGVTRDLYESVLVPSGFDVEVYCHNNEVGAAVLHGDFGRARTKYRIAQRLSGVNPNSRAGALSLLCRATRRW